MRKRSGYRPKHEPSAPMLVMRGLHNQKLETIERMAVESFCGGWATIEHFDQLADQQGVLLLAASTNERTKPLSAWCRTVLGPVLGSIRSRYERTGKMGCNAEELKVLRSFVSKYRDFWLRTPLSLYETACNELQKVYDKMAQEQKQIAA